MKKLILTHVGSNVPEYTAHAIRQVKHTNPGMYIELITGEHEGKQFIKEHGLLADVSHFYTEWLADDEKLKDFRAFSWYKVWGRPNTVYPSPDNFVQGTSERLFVLDAYLRKNANDSFCENWHIENDNLVYGDFDQIKVSDEQINCCYMNEKHTVWNVVHIPNASLLDNAMTWYLDEIKQGNDVVCKKYNLEMAHEMTIMAQYKRLTFFPSIPRKESSVNGWYIDPASYGQFAAGTNNGHGPGFRDTVNHDIGKAYSVHWTGFLFQDDIPHVLDTTGELHRLFNLHMHNKTRIKDFITYE